MPYCIRLQNGSFETPDIAGLKAYHNKNNNTPASRLYYSRDGESGTFFTQYPSGEGGIVWQTTGAAKHWKTGSAGLYIELADGSNRSYNGTRNYPEASYSIDSAYDGQQFAELNCEAYGALYQDVLTAPGTTLHWSLAHRARGRGMQDSMALLIAPVDVAAQITEILAGASSKDDNRGLLVRTALERTVQYNGEEVPIRSFMVGGEITDGNDQWGVHSGDYTVRAGQYVSRFFFLALSSGKGDRREGNLLDKVWFSTEPAPPVAGHANLTLRKTLAGSLTADELTAVRTGLTFTVTRSDGTAVAVISGADMTVGTDPAQCSYTIQDLPVASESGAPYTYTVTETAHAAPAAVLYLASRAAVNGDALQPAGDPPTLANITLLQNGTTYADFENTYARQTGSLRLTKAVDDTMYPHLKPGDLLLYYRLPRSFAAGEVVVFTQDDRRCTGRVAARGGDTVEVTENALLRINGSLVAEPDIYETTPRYDSDVTYPLTLADGEYFILCDAREGAPDSRRYGPVTAENIAGRVIAIVRRNEI